MCVQWTSSLYAHLPAYEDGTECSETSAYKLQTPGNYPKESVQHVSLNLYNNVMQNLVVIYCPFLFTFYICRCKIWGHYLGNCVQEMRIKIYTWYVRLPPGQELNPGHSEYESVVVFIRPRSSVYL